jgi:hypothetical protein
MTDVVQQPATGGSPSASPQGGGAGLKRNILTMPEVLTQSVANAAPSAAVSVLPAIAFASAGNAAWLTFVIATVAMVLIGYTVSVFARRFASAGSFYVYNTKALGSAGGFASGWALVLGYVFTAMATTAGVAIYLGAFLGQIGIQGSSTIAILLMIAIDIGIGIFRVLSAPWVDMPRVLLEETGAIAGGIAGGEAGAEGGAAVGFEIGGPWGAAIGGFVGGIGGAIGGAWAGRKAAHWVAIQLFPPKETKFEGKFE